jgi:flagellar biosynthesis protein FlhG
VGLPLVWLGEVERDDLLGGLTQASVPPSARAASAAFMRRIDGLSRSARGLRA